MRCSDFINGCLDQLRWCRPAGVKASPSLIESIGPLSSNPLGCCLSMATQFDTMTVGQLRWFYVTHAGPSAAHTVGLLMRVSGCGCNQYHRIIMITFLHHRRPNLSLLVALQTPIGQYNQVWQKCIFSVPQSVLGYKCFNIFSVFM